MLFVSSSMLCINVPFCVIASCAAVSGSFESILGSDPHIVDSFTLRLSSIFKSHGATRLCASPLRPRDNQIDSNSTLRPAEIINDQGFVLLLREDLTTNFARAIARCGLTANNLKRFDIDTVYHESDAR